MPGFVKLYASILDSTIWFAKPGREVFLTALLLAEPYELTEETPQIAIGSLEETGWQVPPGWYGFAPASGPGIVHRARVDLAEGMEALAALGEPEPESRSKRFEGRRLVRVNHGFIVLNYMEYREKDVTGAERTRRWREKKRAEAQSVTVTSPDVQRDTVTRHVTQAEAEAEAEAE